MNEEVPPSAAPSKGIAHFLRQFVAFFGVGVIAAIVHYSLLVGLVEIFFYDPVSATLAGYVAGGIVSYVLNRIYTYDAERSVFEAGWRFGLVAAVGFVMTYALMVVFARLLGWHYLAAQIVTTAIVLVWSFLAHKYWSFRDHS